MLIVGTGLGGLAAAIALKKIGVTDLTLLERATEVGGTWEANTYPGIAVDTSILNYSLSYDPNPGWTRLYAGGAELHSYVIGLSERHDLRRHIRFGTTVTEARFDATHHRWEVATSGGTVYTADVLISATGVLSTPKIPDIPGLENFEGTVLHSAQWDSSFDPSGRSIAQIGSGATAAQLVPELAETAEKVYVYQRSAPWVLPRNDREIGRLESWLYRKVPLSLKLRRWRRFWQNDLVAYGFEKQNRTTQTQTRWATEFIERSVRDPQLRRAVIPDYEIGCKRRVMSDDWYPALQRDNVDLISGALAGIGERSVVGTDGVERNVDTLIFSTGFAVSDMIPMKVFGSSGHELHATWSGGAKTHLGLTVSGFPNLFFMAGPNTGIGSGSMTFMLECQARYIAQAVEYLADTDTTALDVLEVVQDRSYRRVQQRLASSVYGSGCAGWYQNPDGTIDTLWPGANSEYWLRTRRFNHHDYLTLRSAADDTELEGTRSS
ncbi:MAG: NAD(P)/FAD-dependent oxidoreductase [Rhodococcus sp. (in: high G+C Gram-positive bacteria)]